MIFISPAFAAMNNGAVSNLLSHGTACPSLGPMILSQCPGVGGEGLGGGGCWPGDHDLGCMSCMCVG